MVSYASQRLWGHFFSCYVRFLCFFFSVTYQIDCDGCVDQIDCGGLWIYCNVRLPMIFFCHVREAVMVFLFIVMSERLWFVVSVSCRVMSNILWLFLISIQQWTDFTGLGLWFNITWIVMLFQISFPYWRDCCDILGMIYRSTILAANLRELVVEENG